MLYQIAHHIQHKCPWLWTKIENANALLFRWRYRQSLQSIPECIEQNIYVAHEQDAESLAAFFARQPKESFTFFHPHEFDANTLRRLLHNPSMIMVVTYNREQQIVGYAFLRSFFIGKAYRGYMVDISSQCQGIGKQLGLALNFIQSQLSIRTYKTISPLNIASLRLGHATCQLQTIATLDNGDIYYECKLPNETTL